jgi:uncharacterized protein
MLSPTPRGLRPPTLRSHLGYASTGGCPSHRSLAQNPMPPHSLSTATRNALADWAAEAACPLLVLFGSTAKDDGRQRLDGDVDLAVWFPRIPDPEERLRIMGRLQDLVGARRVDVVFLHRDTSPVLRFEIFRGGTPLYQSRPGLFTEQVVRALALYEDAIPFRRALLESFRGEEGATS